MIKKELYAAPSTEVLELRLEGITCTSPSPQQNTPETASEWEWE